MIKGAIYSLPIPDKENRHYFFIVSEPVDGKVLLLSSSSVKFQEGTNCEKYYDKSCVMDVNDEIRNKNGRLLIVKKSYILYHKAIEIPYNDIIMNQIKKEYEYCGELDSVILQRIITGAKKSDELAEYYLKYFD
jgi:hypothetical protein